MSKQNEFLSPKNNLTLQTRLLILRVGVALVGTLILLLLILLIPGRSITSKSTPSEATSHAKDLPAINRAGDINFGNKSSSEKLSIV